MVETLENVETVVFEVLRCQMCSHKWLPEKPGYRPRRCVNDKCRSMRWDAAKYPMPANARPARQKKAVA